MKSNSTLKVVEASDSLKYTNNLNGILIVLKVDKKYWYSVVIANGFKSSYDYDGRLGITVPNSSWVDNILKTLETTERELF